MKLRALVLILVAAAAVTAVLLYNRDGDPVPGTGGLGDPSAAEQLAGADRATPADTQKGKPLEQGADERRERVAGQAKADAPGMVELRGRLVLRDGSPVVAPVAFHARADVDPILLAAAQVEMPDPVRADADPRGVFRLRVQPNHRGILSVGGDEFVMSSGPAYGHGLDVEVPATDHDLGDVQVLRAAQIRGQVLGGGRAVPGVEIIASQGGATPVSGFLVIPKTKTDAEGRFTVRGLAPGAHRVETRSSEFMPAQLDIELVEGQRIENLVIKLEPGGVLAGTVLDDLDRPVAGATVTAARSRKLQPGVKFSGFAAGESVQTDAAGRFRLGGLADASVRIRAAKSGFAAIMADANAGQSGLVLRLNRLGMVRGILVDEIGDGIAGSEITAVAQESRGPFLDAGEPVRTDAAGRFVLEGVQPGGNEITAKGKTHLRVSQDVSVRAGETTDNLRLVAKRGATLTVTVLDLQGRPVAGAKVVASTPDEAGGPAWSGRGPGRREVRREVRRERRNGRTITRVIGESEELGTAQSDANGVAVIGGLPEGPAIVKAEHAELALVEPSKVDIPSGGAIPAKVRMQRGGFVVAQVVDAQGKPLSKKSVVIIGPVVGGDAEPPRKQVVADATGTAKFGPLAPGSYRAVLEQESAVRHVGAGMSFAFAGDAHDLEDSRVDLLVKAGESREIELQMPVLTKVTGTVRGAKGPFAGAEIHLFADGEMRTPMMSKYKALSDREGRFEIPNMPSGKYVLSFGKKSAIVPAEKEVVLQKNQPAHEEHLVLPGASISLQVKNQSEGYGVEEAKVSLQRYAPPPPDGAPRRPQRVMMIGITTDTGGGAGPSTFEMSSGAADVQTDDNGRAVIEGVPAGKYTLTIQHREYARVTQVVEVIENQNKDLGVIPVFEGCMIRGAVAFPAKGGGMNMCTVEIRDDAGFSDRTFSRDGSFRFDSLKAGTYKLRAKAVGGDEWGPEKKVEANPEQAARVTLELSGK